MGAGRASLGWHQWLHGSRPWPGPPGASLGVLGLGFLLMVFIYLTLFLGHGVLVLLVLRYQVILVVLSFSALHFIYALTHVPVQEGLAPKHVCELF